MWPWGHAAFGYAWYSLSMRFGLRKRLSDLPVFVTVGAALLPDLVDKPLAWTFGVTATGYGPAHSVFVGLPLAVLVAAAVAHWGRIETGLGFGVGYVSHLVGDLVFQYFDEGHLVTSPVLWPLPGEPVQPTSGLLAHVRYYLGRYVSAILHGEATAYVVFSTLLVLAVFALWVLDGTPGVQWLRRAR